VARSSGETVRTGGALGGELTDVSAYVESDVIKPGGRE
jgi:hypothetical protein